LCSEHQARLWLQASAPRSPRAVIAGALVDARMLLAFHGTWAFSCIDATPSAPPSASAAAAAFARARLALRRTARRRTAARQAAAAAVDTTIAMEHDRCGVAVAVAAVRG